MMKTFLKLLSVIFQGKRPCNSCILQITVDEDIIFIGGGKIWSGEYSRDAWLLNVKTWIYTFLPPLPADASMATFGTYTV